MKTSMLLIAIALFAAGCKQHIKPEERDALTRYVDATCKCTGAPDHESGLRCQKALGQFPDTRLADLDQESVQFYNRAYLLMQDCRAHLPPR